MAVMIWIGGFYMGDSWKLGVRAHDLVEKSDPRSLSDTIHGFGFSRIQLVFGKSFSPFSYDEGFVDDVVSELKRNSIEVSMLGAYFNPVHSSRDVVIKGIENFKRNLEISHRFPTLPFVGSETGSFHDSPWIYDPRNQTEEGYQKTKKVFVDLKDYAESISSLIAIESAWGHVIYSYQQQARLLSELNSENVFATVDLFNLLYEGNFDKRNEIFEGALRTLGEKVKIIHIKDGDVIDGKLVQLAPGEGKFDYPFMLRCVKKYCPDATLVFEGVKKDKISSSMELLRKSM